MLHRQPVALTCWADNRNPRRHFFSQSSNSPQKRHPERSAPQICRVTQRLRREVRRACPERSRGNPGGLYLTHAAQSFSITEAHTGRTRHKIVILSGAPHRLLPDTALGARSRRTPTVLILRMLLGAFQLRSPHRADPRRSSPGALSVSGGYFYGMEDDYVPLQNLFLGFGGRKASSSMGKISPSRSFDSAPQALCHPIKLSALRSG